jgi:tetratricopeptide (TPR) repeat protein
MTSQIAEPILNIYTPQRQSKQQLQAEFIDRKGIRERVLGILRHNTPDKPQQHVILIGPRGMGKTTLLCAIRYSVEEDAELNVAWLPLQFYEEQYNIGDLADFWLECLRHLEQALNRRPEAADRLLDENPADLAEQAQARFFEMLAGTGKRALLLVDNLQEIFAAIDDGHALHKLRALWMTDPRMTVVGAAPSYFDEITAVDQAFHDFFRSFVLERLSQGEMETCLRRYAEILGDKTVPKVIEQAPERVAALRILTGGNPRLVKLGYRVLRDGLDGDLRNDLERLLDEATPFFKHRIDSLAKEARRAFDAIAKRWDPVTVDDIRRELRKPSNYVSAQIKRLIDEGFVEEVGGDKKKLYQVSERFYNVYYLWRVSREGRNRLRWLVCFMRTFYTRKDYKEWARRLETELAVSVSKTIRAEKLAHLHALCAAAEADGQAEAFEALVRDAITHDDRGGLNEEMTGSDPIEVYGYRYLAAEILWLLDNETRRRLGFRLGDWEWWRRLNKELVDVGLQEKVKVNIADMANSHPNSASYVTASGMMLCRLFNRQEEAEAVLKRAINLEPGNGLTWNNMGIIFYYKEDYKGAEVAFRKALEIDQNYSYSWNNLGFVLNVEGNYEEAEFAYKKSIELDPKNEYNHINLSGLYLTSLGRIEDGINELLKGLAGNPEYSYGRFILTEYWQAALPPAAAKIAANDSGADNLRSVLTDVLLEKAATGERAAVRDALLALDDTGQAIFEPLLLALKALDDRAILQRIAREKRDLVLDVMQRIEGEPESTP